jgi:hypothetical protein
MTIEKRLQYAAAQFLATDSTLSPIELRHRFGDALFTTGAPKIILKAEDQGRVKTTPIRILRLTITIRTNAKLDSGLEAAFDALCEALELLCDSSNLLTAFTNDTAAITCMMATRQGTVTTQSGLIREHGYTFDVRAVAGESTTTPPGGDALVTDLGDGRVTSEGDTIVVNL